MFEIGRYRMEWLSIMAGEPMDQHVQRVSCARREDDLFRLRHTEKIRYRFAGHSNIIRCILDRRPAMLMKW